MTQLLAMFKMTYISRLDRQNLRKKQISKHKHIFFTTTTVKIIQENYRQNSGRIAYYICKNKQKMTPLLESTAFFELHIILNLRS